MEHFLQPKITGVATHVYVLFVTHFVSTVITMHISEPHNKEEYQQNGIEHTHVPLIA